MERKKARPSPSVTLRKKREKAPLVANEKRGVQTKDILLRRRCLKTAEQKGGEEGGN